MEAPGGSAGGAPPNPPSVSSAPKDLQPPKPAAKTAAAKALSLTKLKELSNPEARQEMKGLKAKKVQESDQQLQQIAAQIPPPAAANPVKPPPLLAPPPAPAVAKQPEVPRLSIPYPAGRPVDRLRDMLEFYVNLKTDFDTLKEQTALQEAFQKAKREKKHDISKELNAKLAKNKTRYEEAELKIKQFCKERRIPCQPQELEGKVLGDIRAFLPFILQQGAMAQDAAEIIGSISATCDTADLVPIIISVGDQYLLPLIEILAKREISSNKETPFRSDSITSRILRDYALKTLLPVIAPASRAFIQRRIIDTNGDIGDRDVASSEFLTATRDALKQNQEAGAALRPLFQLLYRALSETVSTAGREMAFLAGVMVNRILNVPIADPRVVNLNYAGSGTETSVSPQTSAAAKLGGHLQKAVLVDKRPEECLKNPLAHLVVEILSLILEAA